MNFVAQVLGINISIDDTLSVKRAIFCLFGLAIGSFSLFASAINFYLNNNISLMVMNLTFLTLLLFGFLYARTTRSISVIVYVVTLFFTIVTLYSFYQVTPETHLQYRAFMLVILYFYLFKTDLALKYSVVFGFALVVVQYIFQSMSTSAFSYFILAYFILTLCIWSTYYTTMVIERMYNNKITSAQQRDSLTGSLNRKGIEEVINEWVAKNETFVIMMLDIDDFKQINDSKGHLIGDEYIKNLSNTLNLLVNESFQFGRYGGDEFILVRKRDLEPTKIFVEKLMNDLTNNQNYPTNVSVGFAEFSEGDDVEKIKYHADEALYYSKSHGKGKVTSYDEVKHSNTSISTLSNERVIAKYLEFGNKSDQGVLHVDEFGSILNANDYFLKMVDCSSLAEVNPNRMKKDFISLEDDEKVFKTTRVIKGQEILFFEQYLMFEDTNQEHRFIIALIQKSTE
jgi:diguanylate cyclase (GGDEF)-like protein